MKDLQIQAVLFDFDGTLTTPGSLNFSEIKAEIGCPENIPVLEFLETVDDAEAKKKALAALDDFETGGAADSTPNAGAEGLIRYLKSKDLKVGILTRNSPVAVHKALENFPSLNAGDFDVIITREDPAAFKPSPEGVLLAAEKMGVPPEAVMMVGDFAFDVHAGKAAGSKTVLLSNGHKIADLQECDHVISRLDEIKDVLRLYAPLPAGKFPNELLRTYLDAFDFQDPSVIVDPGVGEDIAAVNVDGEEVLILKTDPITFATDAIGHYAVLINANDIATSGALPRWFLTTLMFPVGSTPSEIFGVMRDLESVCRQWGITLCGGHTEITDAVNRPVVVGTLAGTVKRSGLIEKRNMRPGDRLLLTKGVAVEGTTIIAREFGDRLLDLGMQAEAIKQCKGFLSWISILDEAGIAAACPGTSAMHDVTEGGLATALEELSVAGGHRLRVLVENIPLLPQTQAVCGLLGIHPLGLIGSGSLIICCREAECGNLIGQINRAGIQTTYIGEVLEAGEGVEARAEGEVVEWPRFEADELTRLF